MAIPNCSIKYNKKINYKDLFGCMNWTSEMNWSGNTKTELKMNWSAIPNMLFGCAWHFLLELKVGIQFQFLFGCANRGVKYFFEFGQHKIVYMYGK